MRWGGHVVSGVVRLIWICVHGKMLFIVVSVVDDHLHDSPL